MPNDASMRIAVWGPTQAGKTVFLYRIFKRCRVFDWTVLPGRQPPANFIADADFAANRPPAPTARTQKGTPFHYDVESRDGKKASIYLEDRAGGDWTECGSDIVEELTKANALVMLLHPPANPQDLLDQVDITLGRLYLARGQKEARPVAVCLSQADRLVETIEDYQLAKERPEIFLRRKLTGFVDLEKRIPMYCEGKRYRFLVLSSLGIEVRFGLVQHQFFLDQELIPRLGTGGMPMNLMEPFEWILSQLGQAG